MQMCFAIMPITTPREHLDTYNNDLEHFVRVARHIFKPAAEAAGYEFRAPTSSSAEIIQAEIIKNLEEAALVLCDISLWNANVFFELGIRVALDRPVAMVRDNYTPRMPFDTAMLNCHTYEASMNIWSVEAEIPKLSEFIATAGKQSQNSLWRYFGITQRAERIDPGNPEDAKLDLLLADLGGLRAELQDAQDKLRGGRSDGTMSRDAEVIPLRKIVNGVAPDVFDTVEYIGKTITIMTHEVLDEGAQSQIVRRIRDTIPGQRRIAFAVRSREW